MPDLGYARYAATSSTGCYITLHAQHGSSSSLRLVLKAVSCCCRAVCGKTGQRQLQLTLHACWTSRLLVCCRLG